jgi:hypothetical protein
LARECPYLTAPFAPKAKMSEEAALRKFPAIQLFQVQSTILMGLNIVTQHSYFCAFAISEAAPLRLSFSYPTYSLADGFFNFLDACASFFGDRNEGDRPGLCTRRASGLTVLATLIVSPLPPTPADKICIQVYARRPICIGNGAFCPIHV